MQKIWIHKSYSFKEAEEFDRKYYSQMSAQQRLDIVQRLREIYFKLSKQWQKIKNNHASRKRLRRVIKIIQ